LGCALVTTTPAESAYTALDAVAVIFGWDRDLLEGRTAESRKWREQVDQWWSTRLSIPHLTPRWVLQNWGTDVFRKYFHDSIWIASLENQLRNSETSVVITDARFPNEHETIRSQGGIVVRVKRNSEPDWFAHAVNVNCLDPLNPQWQISKDFLNQIGVHASETAWAGLPFEHVIENDQTIQHLYEQVDEILFSKLPKMIVA
jgi:hypothetical protein